MLMVGRDGIVPILIGTSLLMLSAGIMTAEPSFIGSAVCRSCHPNIWLNFYKNPHARTMQSGEAPPDKEGCEGCHGPGSEHVAGRGDKSKIIAFPLLRPDRVIDNCLRCHSESIGRAQIRRPRSSRPRKKSIAI